MLKGDKSAFRSFSDNIDGLLKRGKPNLGDYFSAIKDEDLLRGLEEESRKILGFHPPETTILRRPSDLRPIPLEDSAYSPPLLLR